MVEHNNDSHRPCEACCGDPFTLRTAYAFGIVLWVAILVFLGYQPVTTLEWLLVALPVVLFLVAAATAGAVSPFAEKWVVQSNNVSTVVVLIFPILIWATARVDHNRTFLLLVLTATGLAVVSLIDLWVTEAYLPLAKHLRSVCQTLSVTLTLLALVCYYHDQIHPLRQKNKRLTRAAADIADALAATDVTAAADADADDAVAIAAIH